MFKEILTTKLKDITLIQLPALTLMVVVASAILGVFLGGWFGFVSSGEIYKADTLARQIAEGTHEVQHTRDEFGTLEYRIVEIKEGE